MNKLIENNINLSLIRSKRNSKETYKKLNIDEEKYVEELKMI